MGAGERSDLLIQADLSIHYLIQSDGIEDA